MTRTPRCFACNKFARVEDCVLLRNKKSGNRRWFHRKEIKPECHEFVSHSFWEEVDPSLGETTEEEERKLAQLD
ncbi:unnamed protein product [marine sediment metagenome]|uniref:Uncharacterized protein n=1 Tax=marine sediment metagenome TaxID=412755 RepID=X1TQ25_9ZZZZ